MTSDFRLPNQQTSAAPSRDDVELEDPPTANQHPSEAIATRAAQQVWEFVYQEGWPEEWRVGWMNHANFGVCIFDQKLILLSWSRYQDYTREVLSTLIHEFTHVRYPRLCHGNKFSRLVWSACEQLAGAPPQLALQDEPRQELAQHLRALRRSARQGDPEARGLLAERRCFHAIRLALEARAVDLTSCEERQLPTSG